MTVGWITFDLITALYVGPALSLLYDVLTDKAQNRDKWPETPTCSQPITAEHETKGYCSTEKLWDTSNRQAWTDAPSWPQNPCDPNLECMTSKLSLSSLISLTGQHNRTTQYWTSVSKQKLNRHERTWSQDKHIQIQINVWDSMYVWTSASKKEQ